MIQPEREGKAWALVDADDVVYGAGTEIPTLSVDEIEDIVWFATVELQQQDARVIAFERRRWQNHGTAEIEVLKGVQEYAGKAENAERFLRNNTDATDAVGDYTAALYPWLAIECEEVLDCTPREAADAIWAALNAGDADAPPEETDGPITIARRRIRLRQKVREDKA